MREAREPEWLEAGRCRTADVLERLQDLVLIESPSGDREGLGRMATVLSGWLREAGLTVAQQDTPAGPLVRARRAGPEPSVLVLGHMDSVWARGTLDTMPFRLADDRAWGPGAFDMKGGLALLITALTALRDRSLPSAVEVLLTPDEEVGSGTSRAVIEEVARAARMVMVLEAPGPDGALKIGRKGVGDFRLEVTGRAAHAGLEPERGVDAVQELAHQVLALKRLQDPARGTTINVGVVAGGTRANVVAEQAWGAVDVRILDPAEADRITGAFRALKPELSGARVTVTGGWNRPPMSPTARVRGILARASQRWEAYGRGALAGVVVGGASDGNFTAPLAPTIDGLGPLGDGAHARHEHVLIEPLGDRARLLADLLLDPRLGFEESIAVD
jgi:glutamate carboxypeptidase